MSTESVREWIGGRFKLPAAVQAMGAQGTEMVMWVELPELLVVGQELIDPSDPQRTFGQSLVRAMAAPRVGQPRRPQRVRVADVTLAEELKSFAFLEIETAATPEFELLASVLAVTLGERSYLADPLLAPEALEDFFAAASVLWSARPWTITHGEPLLQLDIPWLDIHDGGVSIVGALGNVRGFAFFPRYEDVEQMLEGAEDMNPGSRLAAHCGLYVSFEAAEHVPVGMRREALDHGWQVPAERVYPVLQCVIDGLPAPVLAPDVRLATMIAHALAGFVLQHPQTRHPCGELKIRETLLDESGMEVILTLPHPRAAS
jgi:hypothetical protein